jgi:hypothetical protein
VLTVYDLDENTTNCTPYDGAVRSPPETLQAQLQRTPLLGSTPGQLNTDFNGGTNIWDFHNLDFLDDNPLWALDNGGFPMGGIEVETSGQLQEMHIQVSDFSGDTPFSNHRDHPEKQRFPSVLDLRNIWFTKIQRSDESHSRPSFFAESTTTSQATSSPRESEIVDEECRRDLTRSLIHPFPQEDLLPSSGFLVGHFLPPDLNLANSLKNLCVRRYLKCFNPMFPIIHTGTFQRTSENGLLLISMASVGCLFLGSQAAVQRGRRIFETLNKAILTSVSNANSRVGMF